MIHLRTLGATDLRRSPGEEVRAVLAQPKRLALLAYLAIARPRGTHRKDTLRALFWPDADDHHARLDLNRAVYFLRHAVGEGVLAAGPGDALRVARETLWCDAVAFEEAFDAGRFEDALELYHGDLLVGCFASVAPEFEHWLDQEREHLQKRAVTAALALAEQEETRGNVAGAVRWAGRATELGPYAEGAMRRLMGLLDLAGDRAEAVRAYREFARRLEGDLGVAPSPETRSLIEAIRARGQPSPLPQRPRRSVRGRGRPARRSAPPDVRPRSQDLSSGSS